MFVYWKNYCKVTYKKPIYKLFYPLFTFYYKKSITFAQILKYNL